jgi:hypothetical protein
MALDMMGPAGIVGLVKNADPRHASERMLACTPV